MSSKLAQTIESVKNNQYSFCKFVTANDAGETGAHQGGIYIPKNSIQLLFSEPGKKGENKEKISRILWQDGVSSDCKLSYYGKGTRNEYRITRLGKNFTQGDFVILSKESEEMYLGFILRDKNEILSFLEEFNLNKEDTNSLISKNFNTNELNFKPRAHILILLGEELIKNPVMAIYELIKNSYDADATKVDVEFKNVENFEDAYIIIKDDGIGITEEILKNVWFEPGNDFRKPVNEKGKRDIRRTIIYDRVPMGEKGVGRFAVHKLGSKIKMVTRPMVIKLDKERGIKTRTLLDYELVVDIDWTIFSQSKYLDNVSVKWQKKEDPLTFRFKDVSGTLIQISGLKEQWTRGMARQLRSNTISMLSPRNQESDFKVTLDFENSWLENLPDTNETLESAPYKLTAFIDSDFNLTFEYLFYPSNNNLIGRREINKSSENPIDTKKYKRNIKEELKPYIKYQILQKNDNKDEADNLFQNFESEKIPFGNLMIELYSFDLDSASLKDSSNSPAFIKALLKENSGIKVYKGNLRVYDYGEPGIDWLGLDLRRIQNKEWFSNNQVIGFIYLDASTSGSLIEKTNREGFIQNHSFEYLMILLDFLLTEFSAERQADRRRWLNFNKKGTTNSFQQKVEGFKQLIFSTDLSNKEKQEALLAEAEKIEEQYEEDKNTLLIPAGVGMTASFAIHEIEKLVPRMEESIKNFPIDRNLITSQVHELKDYTEGILSVLKKAGSKPVLVSEVISQAVSNYSLRLKSRKIHVELDLDNPDTFVVGDRRLLITVLMNILDNSLYWLDTIYRESKQIFIKVYSDNTSTSIYIIDNGPGFKDSVEDLVRPYFTRKKDGIGIGLYLIDTIMTQYGRLNFLLNNEFAALDIPKEYNGAGIELKFNKR